MSLPLWFLSGLGKSFKSDAGPHSYSSIDLSAVGVELGEGGLVDVVEGLFSVLVAEALMPASSRWRGQPVALCPQPARAARQRRRSREAIRVRADRSVHRDLA